MAVVKRPASFVRGHTLTPADWKAEVADQFAGTIPWLFTTAGQLAYAGGERDLRILDAPAAGQSARLLTFDNGVLAWRNVGTYIAGLIPNGGIARAKLAGDASLPDPSGNGGKYVRINSAGTAYELVAVTLQHNTLSGTVRTAQPNRAATASFGSFLNDDLINFGTGTHYRWRDFTSATLLSVPATPIGAGRSVVATKVGGAIQLRMTSELRDDSYTARVNRYRNAIS